MYKYIPDFGFYDPDLSTDSLEFNLKKLMNKMVSYRASNFSNQKITNKASSRLGNKVFIVHGHDDAAKQEMARTLEKGGFEAVILHEQPDKGKTIIEKLLDNMYTVSFAVVLYTECDKGGAKEEPFEKQRYRARQNVVFEHGLLIAKLGRDHVCALVKGNVEYPSDIAGVVYVPMDPNGGWKTQLAKNMIAVGLNVDLNKFCK